MGMAIDPRDPRVTHGLIPLMAMMRKKKFLEAQKKRAAEAASRAEAVDEEPRPRRRRGWLW